MSAGAHTPLAGVALSTITGQHDAQQLIHVIRQGCAPADALAEAVDQVRGVRDEARLRGFFREIQKAVERTA